MGRPDLTARVGARDARPDHRMDGTRRPITFDHELALHRDGPRPRPPQPPARRPGDADAARKQIWASGTDVELPASRPATPPGSTSRASSRTRGSWSPRATGSACTRRSSPPAGRIRDGRFRRFDDGDRGAGRRSTQPAASSVPVHLVQPHAELWPSVEQQVFAALEARGKDRASSLASMLEEARRGRRGCGRRCPGTSSSASIRERLRQRPARAAPARSSTRPTWTQFERDREALERRLDALPEETEAERARIRRRYTDPEPHLFPAAVMLLLPEGRTARCNDWQSLVETEGVVR